MIFVILALLVAIGALFRSCYHFFFLAKDGGIDLREPSRATAVTEFFIILLTIVILSFFTITEILKLTRVIFG